MSHPHGNNGSPVPLVVGVTGHRNLVAAEVPQLEDRVRLFLEDLKARFPQRDVVVMCPLADGADRLVARVAADLDLKMIIPLPMARDLYEQDFATLESQKEFERLCAKGDVFELPLVRGNLQHDVSVHGTARDKQYAQLGVFICAHCHILLALWDGRHSDKLGGTGQVVEFHHNDVMPGYTEGEPHTELMLADDESDLVYHIVCSRDQIDGAPPPPLQPLQTTWFTTNESEPRSDMLPARYEVIFSRTAEFNRDSAEHEVRIGSEKWSLQGSTTSSELSAYVEDIDRMFGIADWLAIHFQTRVNWTLLLTYTLAVLMGLAFVAYADVAGGQFTIYLFLLFFGLGVVLVMIAQRKAWHRRYLDYRALAEGLRVQYYWAVAGVSTGKQTKYAHDNFLQKRDSELGWIRNVMRVAGLRSDVVVDDRRPESLDFVIREWVGGQLEYYGRKSAERTRLLKHTDMIAMITLWTGIGVTVVLAVFQTRIGVDLQTPLLASMGILPLIAGVREAYSHKKADKELIKQYGFMHRIFSNAKRKLDSAVTDREKQRILRALGNAALDEHAEWIFMHRDRPPEHGRLG